ncbi:pyrroline-5-carboxylate reductase family protein [Gemmatimonas sp.]|uniref:pyrroline-5-carboxylate reductase family protein n=1 Tax=Gemmatimonas sp. TaxID=1962908 RepID=UPI00356479EC
MNVGIIGAGAMGAMLVRAHSRYAGDNSAVIRVANRSAAPLEALKADVPGLRTGTPEEVTASADVLILCLPAGPYIGAAAALAALLRPDAVFVCISSGVSLEDLSTLMPNPIIRLVPNVAHQVGRGVALVIPGPRASTEQIEKVCSFMRPFSRPMLVGEADVRIATDICSCGPAIVACLAQLLATSSAANARGLAVDEIQQMCVETLAGVGALLDDSYSLTCIVDAVATHGGTTEAALCVLRSRIPAVMQELHHATREREQWLRAQRPGLGNESARASV